MGGTVDNLGGGGPKWDLGVPPPQITKETQSVLQLAGAYSKDGLTKAEAGALEQAVTMAMSDPTLPAYDRAVLANFLNKLSMTDTRGFWDSSGQVSAGDSSVNKARNDWMVASALCELFESSNEIAMLVAKIARQESQLRLAIGQVMLSMAKESLELSKAAGEARAQQFEQEAAKCWTEMGVALGQIAVTAFSLAATAKMEQKYAKEYEEETGAKPDVSKQVEISQVVGRKLDPLQQVMNQTLTAIKSAIEAGINLKKAELERQSAYADGVKQLLDKIYQLLNDTYSNLGEDIRNQRQAIEKLFQTLESAQRTMGEQWKA